MDTIQHIFDQAMEDLPATILSKVLLKKAEKHGITLSVPASVKIAKKLLVEKSGFEFKLPESKKSSQTIEFTDEDLEEANRLANDFSEKIPDIIASSTEKISQQLLQHLKKDWLSNFQE